MNTAASSDEKVMAALAHGSVLFMFLGPVVPVILWASQRKKSKYVSFHALQAMGYQALIFWLWIVVMLFVMVLVLVLMSLSIMLIERTREPGVFPFLLQVPIFLIIFGWMGLSFAAGIVGAIACLLGRDFRYPFFGRWLERYLSYDADPESHIVEAQEDNWVAGVCHGTAILQVWGLVTPLIVWFTQKERSARLRFQAMQAFIYQMIALIAYFMGMGAYMAFFVGLIFTMILGEARGSHELQGPSALMMIVFGVVMIVLWLTTMILMPIYYFLAGLAGFRVVRGHDFHYPVLGKIIEKRMETSQRLEPAV